MGLRRSLQEGRDRGVGCGVGRGGRGGGGKGWNDGRRGEWAGREGGGPGSLQGHLQGTPVHLSSSVRKALSPVPSCTFTGTYCLSSSGTFTSAMMHLHRRMLFVVILIVVGHSHQRSSIKHCDQCWRRRRGNLPAGPCPGMQGFGY